MCLCSKEITTTCKNLFFAGKAGSGLHWGKHSYSTAYCCNRQCGGVGIIMAMVSYVMVLLVGDDIDVEITVLSGLVGLEITEFNE